jgi:hypothetical protein
MEKLLFLLIVLSVCGCASSALLQESPALLHESSESSLLTEEAFMERVSQSVTQIYEGLRAISDAAKLFAIDNDGNLPTGGFSKIRASLLDGGYLNAWPVLPPFAFTDPDDLDLKYSDGYDNMDGLGEMDDVIYAQDLKIEVCEEFVHRYSSDDLGDIIYDYEANGEKYPGEVLGRHVKIYAITWSMDKSPEYCDIEWVMQYNIPPPPQPGRK